MKKNLRFLLVVLAIMPFILTSCAGDDESMGAATIIFDAADNEITISNGVLSDVITGSVTAPEDADIESITVTAIYTKNGQTNETHVADRNDLTEVSGSNRGKYIFRFDETTKGIKDHLSDLEKIRIVAVVGNGDTSTKDLIISRPTNPNYDTFTVTMGGMGTTKEGSYLSIKDKEVYKQSQITSANNNVEIVFTGTDFISADKATASDIKNNGNWAIIEKTGDGQYSFETSTNYKGYLDIIEGKPTGSSVIIKVTVISTEIQK